EFSRPAKTSKAGTSSAKTRFVFFIYPPMTMMLVNSSSPTRAERVAGLHRALLISGHEPLLPLRGRAVGEGVRHHPARRLPLQRAVADRARCGQRRVDIAGRQDARPLLLLTVAPDAGQAVGLQLDLDLQRVGLSLSVGLLLHPRHAGKDAEQFLNVVAGLMGDVIGRGDFAGIARAAAETRLDLAEEAGVEEYRLV